MGVRFEKDLPLMALCLVIINPKSEYRNPKQILNSNFPMFKTELLSNRSIGIMAFLSFGFLSLDIVSNFLFRYSSFIVQSEECFSPSERFTLLHPLGVVTDHI